MTRQPKETSSGIKLAPELATQLLKALPQVDPLWNELFPAERAHIVALLVERADIGADGLNVRLRVDGLGSLACEMLAGGVGEAA